MTYEPKHRGEPVKKWRVHYMESERGWGQDYWHTDYDTEDEAKTAYDETNASNTAPVAPDYYIQAQRIEEITL